MTQPQNSVPADETFPHVDPAVRPQDDLQRHVNGSWLSTAEIPPDLDAYGSFHELRDKAEADVRAILDSAAEGDISSNGSAGTLDSEADRDPAGQKSSAADIARRVGTFYAAFMDAERAQARRLEPIEPMLTAIDQLDSAAGLVELSARWQRDGVDGLFAAGAMHDAGDPTRMLWHIVQGGIGLPDESYYRDEGLAEILVKYREHLGTLLYLGGVEDAQAAADAVVDLETRIAGLHWDNVTTRDAQKRYNLTTGDDVVELMPLITSAFAGWGLQPRHTAEIVLAQPDVLPGMQRALEEVPLETWKMWLRVQVLRWAAPLLHDELVHEHFAFYSATLSGAQQLKDRWKRGVALTNAHLGEDVAQLYVARHYPEQARAAMDELIDALIEAYRRSIADLEWMSVQTREQALTKLEAFRPMVGYPNRWIDYSSVEVDPADVVGNVRRAAEFEWERDLAKLDEGPDPEEWHMTPQTVNAYYSPLENVICFPAAILQPPFFAADRDMAANFGAIGAVIGHEIGHGFDDQGSRYGADGSLTNWWTEEDRAAFEARTAKLVDQYSALAPSMAPEYPVNGELTLGENIGDLGGLGIAHQAYALWSAAQDQGVAISAAELPAPAEDAGAADLSGDQRFFFSWAQAWRNLTRRERAITLISIDPHAPAEFRANQVVKNLDAFHSAFGTQRGDQMYLEPAERVTIW